MDRRLFATFVILLGMLLAAVVTQAEGPAPKPKEDRSQWTFFDWMGQASYSLDALGQMLDDPQAHVEKLAEVEQLQWALMHMKGDAATMKLPGKSKQTFHSDEQAARSDIRRGLNEMLQSSLRLETALMTDDNKAAHGELTALVQVEREMHQSHRGSSRKGR